MPKKRRITVTCPKCEGSGEAQLSGVLAETYVLLLSCPEPVGAHDLLKLSGEDIKGQTMYDRLQRLEDYGLVISSPQTNNSGAVRLWAAVR